MSVISSDWSPPVHKYKLDIIANGAFFLRSIQRNLKLSEGTSANGFVFDGKARFGGFGIMDSALGRAGQRLKFVWTINRLI